MALNAGAMAQIDGALFKWYRDSGRLLPQHYTNYENSIISSHEIGMAVISPKQSPDRLTPCQWAQLHSQAEA